MPKELTEEEAGEGATEFHDYEGGGIGEGEGKKDVSDTIENEDQVRLSGRTAAERPGERLEDISLLWKAEICLLFTCLLFCE